MSSRRSNIEGSKVQKLAIYTHDTYGMGHVRRCFNIINALSARCPDWPILLISGSPALSKFDDRPANVDILKLPTLTPTGEEKNQPPHLPLPIRDIIGIRKDVIKSALRRFSPDIFLVDNFPLGARKELLPSLKILRDHSVHKVLGLRDIVEDPSRTCERWAKEGIYGALSDDYDRIIIYGHEDILDAAKSYQLPPEARSKLLYCGYVTRPASQFCDQTSLRRRGDDKQKKILVTVGGGGDGLPLLNAFFKAAEQLKSFSVTVVSGPMMGGKDRQVSLDQARHLDNVTVVSYLPDLVRHMAEADVVICMGGYNTAAELLALKRRAIIVPRDWRFGQHAIGVGAGEEKEQTLRAEAMARNGYGRVIEPKDLSAETLLDAIRCEIENKDASRHMAPMPIDGAARVAEYLSSLSASGKETNS